MPKKKDKATPPTDQLYHSGSDAMQSAIDSQNLQESTSEKEFSSYGSDDHVEIKTDVEPTKEPSEKTNDTSKEDIQNDQAESEYDYDEDYGVYSEEEKKAIADGWRPKDIFRGDPGKWRDAKTWNDNAKNSVKNIFDQQNVRMAEMERKQTEMLELLQQEKIRSAKIELNSIEKERDIAIQDADVDRVKKLDNVIFELKSTINNIPKHNSSNYENTPGQEVQHNDQKSGNKPPPREVIDFYNRNPWMNARDELSVKKSQYASFLENDLNQRRVPMSIKEKFAYIENEVNRIFSSPKQNVAPVENKRAPVMYTENKNKLPLYRHVDEEAKKYIELYAHQFAQKSKLRGKDFDVGKFREKYVKDLIEQGVLDQSGKRVR